jgi:cell wall-associated NlpC family hydrolase
MTDRAQLIATARRWIGVPFRHQGRNRAGVDCGGLLIAIGQEAGLQIIEPDVYSLSPNPRIIRTALEANCNAIQLHAAQPGDVLWLRFGADPTHVAMRTDLGILHAWSKPGMVVEHRIDGAWHRRIVSAWAPRGLA